MAEDLRDKKVLLAIAARGVRTVALADALESVAMDPRAPEGCALDWTRDVAATRELALFVRAQLGVEPSSATRVQTLAASLADPIARDLVLAHVPADADAVALRLVAHWRAMSSAIEALPLALLVHAAARLAASHSRSLAAREAPAVALAERPSSFARAEITKALARVESLMPDCDAVSTRSPSLRLANVAPPPRVPPFVLRAEDTTSAIDRVYRAIRVGAPEIETAMLVQIRLWPPVLQIQSLDALADANSLSNDAIGFLVSIDDGRAGVFEPKVVEAARHALGTQLPERWRATIDARACSIHASERRAAAYTLARIATPDAARRLDELERDPARSVRRAAREARSFREARRFERLWIRRMLWVAVRDDDAASLVFDTLMQRGLGWTSSAEVRRVHRLARRVDLSARARQRLELAFPGFAPHGAEAATNAPVEIAWLSTTAGQTLAVALSLEVGPTPTEHFATIVRTDDITVALPSEIADLWRGAPSHYMRLRRALSADVAVTLRFRNGRIDVIAADPRLLERIA